MSAPLEQLLDQAQASLERGKLDAASRTVKLALKSRPDNADALHLLGLVEHQRQRHEVAAKTIERAITLCPTNPIMRNNAGLAWMAHGQTGRALEHFDQALAIDEHYAQAWFNRGNAHRLLGHLEEAQASFERACDIDPYFADALNNLGIVLRQQGQLQGAVDAFERCLHLSPSYYPAMNNLGLARQALGQDEQALDLYLDALKLAPDYLESRINAGNLLQNTGRYAQALEHYQVAHKLAPTLDLLLGNLAQCNAMLCDWRDFKTHWRQITKLTRDGYLPCSPFVLLSGCDDAALSLQVAQRYNERLVNSLNAPPLASTAPAATQAQNKKLRVGYFSSDFREHPVAYLTVGIIEHHDRENFHVIGFALAKPGDDPLGQRICRAFDELIDLSAHADNDAVLLARSYHLDIAIDLNGYIDGGRPSIFRARVAPTQINYYGYPGTMGAKFMDYIVGDRVLIPPGSEIHYQEKIIFLPGSYQPNDNLRPISAQSGSRTDHGLPEKSFVFCSFNKPYKITPPVFDVWMNILSAVPHSVLWLQSVDETVIRNLRAYAAKRGVADDRLVFAGRVPSTADHLARYRLADLFLDTLPYTAHTTANDALWAGLPVLGLSGQTFSARVSESLLATLGLNDLVMRSLNDYQAKAIELARSPEHLAEIRQRLAVAKQSSSLYKPQQITQWLELGLKQAHERQQKGLEPDHVYIEATKTRHDTLNRQSTIGINSDDQIDQASIPG